MMGHCDVTYKGMACKILKKIDGLATRIELTWAILINATTLKLAELRTSIFAYIHIRYHVCSGSRFRRSDGHEIEIFSLTSLII